MAMKILLIDDMREAQYVRNPMRTDGALFDNGDVVTARTVEQGLELLRQDDYDLLLLDHDMGDRNGMEVLSFLEGWPGHIPRNIFLVTANIVAGPRMMDVLKRFYEKGYIRDYGWIR